MFAKIQNNQVIKYPIINIRQELPNISFPEVINDLDLPLGYVMVKEAEIPDYNPQTHKLVPNELIQVNNKWQASYSAVELSTDELQQYTDMIADIVRKERNNKLIESDWTQLADSPVNKTAWASYRQLLRDIPTQTGFPFDINWPTSPQ